MARSRTPPRGEHVPGQLDLWPYVQARRTVGDLPAVPCPLCRCRGTDEIDRDLWECPECGHEWRAEMEAQR